MGWAILREVDVSAGKIYAICLGVYLVFGVVLFVAMEVFAR